MKGPAFLTIWIRNARVWRKNIMASFIGNLGQPLLFLLAMGYGLGQKIEIIEGFTYLQYIAPGLVASSVMYSAAFETTYGSYTRLTIQKSFEAILVTPLGVNDLVLGEIVWAATKGMVSGAIMLATLPLFGVWPSAWTITLIPILFVSGMFFAAFGLIMTAVARNYDFFNYFISLVLTPLFLFSGIFFSLKTMAPKARIIFELLPLTPTVNLSRMMTYGQIEGHWFLMIVGSLLLNVFTVWLACVLMHRRLIQ